MGIKIMASMDNDFPYPITVTLECDLAAELFCCGFESFNSPDGFVGCHSAAMQAGWLERNTSQGRKWLCPRCSGK